MKALGKTGLQVSRLCLGTAYMGMAPPGNPDEQSCIELIHQALDCGINFIDTADMYGGQDCMERRGIAEKIVGRAIKNQRDKIILSTKFSHPMGDDINQQGASRKWIVKAVDDSLRRLGTDYIDLYQIHRYHPETAMQEILFTLTELVRQGKIRYFGSSKFSADRIVESHWLAEKHNLLRFRCEQSEYSLFTRDIERTLLPACHRYGMGVITFSPLNAGFLSGKYQGPEDLLREDSLLTFFGRYMPKGVNPEEAFYRDKLQKVQQLTDIARQSGLTLAQLAVAFVLSHPFVTSSIIGPLNLKELTSLLPAVENPLSEEILDKVDTVVPPGFNVQQQYYIKDGLDLRRPKNRG